MDSNAVFEPSCSVGDGNDLGALERKRQERRERQKVKKQIKKEEKRFQRDEEIRKKRLAPKGQKITIIDQSTMERILSKDSGNSKTKTISHFDDEFPPIFPPLPRERHESAHTDGRGRYSHKTEIKKKKSPLVAANVQPSDCNERDGHLEQPAAASNPELLTGKEVAIGAEGTDKVINSVPERPRGKRPKRTEPICFQIGDILKLSAKPPEPAQKHAEAKNSNKSQLYSGNILDSDKPERKRGKQRETPKKKKVSSLKSVVLEGREKRRLDREAMKSALESGNTEEQSDGQNIVQNECKESVPENTMHDESKSEALESVNTEVSVNTLKEDFGEKKVVDEKKSEEENQNVSEIWKVHELKNVDENQNVNVHENSVKETLEENGELHEDKLQKVQGEVGKCSAVVAKINSILSVDVSEVQDILKPKIHNRQFREYCDHLMTIELHQSTVALVEDIVKFQDRQFLRSPLKAVAHRRHIVGLKQVQKFLMLHRCRLVIIAPDLERNDLPGGLDERVNVIKALAKEQNVPYVFAVPRRHLGRILMKKVPVSAAAVLNFDGTESNFQTLISALKVAREQYQLLVQPENLSSEPQVITETEPLAVEQPPAPADVNKIVIASLLSKLTEEQKGRESPFLTAIEQRCKEDFETSEEEE